MAIFKTSLASGLLLAGTALAIDLDVNSLNSVRDAAKTIAESIIDRYPARDGSGVPGLFGDPYYFWEGGLAWDSLIHYWHQTGDDSYNDIISEAMRFQLGEANDYAPVNQTKSLGNDDQATWALAAMTAAEYGFPSDGMDVSWLQIATNVFNEQAARWDEDTCNGGLRWQIFSFNNGYNYKNSMSNGDFYQLAGRLARFTGNGTYEDWGQRVLDWSYGVGLIAGINDTNSGAVYDGTDVTQNCTRINHIQWTANAGTFLAGGGYMWNYSATMNNMIYIPLVESINYTFASENVGARPNPANGTLVEIACEPNDNCNTDQLAFKAIVTRALAQTRALASDSGSYYTYTVPVDIFNSTNLTQSADDRIPAWTTSEKITFILQQSAMGAAAQCSGGESGTVCGSDWTSDEWDGSQGLGQDLSALNVILANIPIGPLATVNQSAPTPGRSGTLEDDDQGVTDNGTVYPTDGPEAASSDGAGLVAVASFGLLAALGSAVIFL